MDSAKEIGNAIRRDHDDNEVKIDVLPGYQFIRELGHGTQGQVFLAKRQSDGIQVAIKRLNIHSVKTWKSYELFHREADVLKILKLDGVAQFYDAIDRLEDTPPCSYIIQEYIEGESLKQMLDKGHRFHIDDVYDILIQTLTILDKLHSHKPPIIHRDIKPANLIISSGVNGKYKVTVIDFGAVSNPQVQSGGSTIAGTFGFMPPEQLMGQSAPASDIYALAAVAVQLLSGKSPAEMPVKDFRLIFEPELQNQPHELVSLLRQMLEPKAENRLADPSKIILQLNNIRTHQTVHLSQNSKHYSASYNNDLAKVNFIGQNSNIDLWQALPDETPRDIPEFYANIIKQYSSAFEKYINSFSQSKVDDAELARNDVVSAIPVILILSGMLGPTVVALLIGLYDFLFSANIFKYLDGGILIGLGYILGVIVIILLCIFPAFKYYNAKHMLALKEKYVKRNPFGLSAIDVADHMTDLIKHGRKTIAIIASIQYINQNSDDIEPVPHHPSDTNTGGDNAVQYIACRYPVFKILYRFNPPDDERQCNILHSCYVHTDPENNYKLGDPFPILYMIQNKGVFDAVISMPYPLSDLDLIENDKIVDISTSEGHTNR